MASWLAGVALFAIACSSRVEATTLRQFDTRALTVNSDAVIIGQVTAVRSEWTADHRRIVTRVTVRVSETLKGGPTGLLEVVQLGGELDGVKVTVAGCPAYRTGEEALFFLSGRTSTRMQVTGLAQGKFDLRRDPATGRLSVQRTTPGFRTNDARSLRAAPADEAAALSLDDLLDEVRKYVGEERR